MSAPRPAMERVIRAIKSARTPGQGRDAWAAAAAEAAIKALFYQDGTDEERLIRVATSERVEAVSLALAWDELLLGVLTEGQG